MPLKLTTYHTGSDIPPLPGNDTFHSTTLFRIYEATPGYSPLLIVASLEGQPVAKLLAVVRRSVRLFPPSIIHRCEVFGNGEYLIEGIDREAVFKDMLQRLTEEALRSCFLIEFRNLPDARFGYRSFRSCSYFPINWLRVRNSLHDTPRTEVRFSPSRIRQIKKGLKNGAEVRVARTISIHGKYAVISPVGSSSDNWPYRLPTLSGKAASLSSLTKIRLSVVVPVSTRATMLTFGFRAACAKPTPCNTLAYWLYGKPWTMPANRDTAIWSFWT